MLWGTGGDYFRKGPRYDPGRLNLYSITDTIADTSHISACFESLAAVMDSTDTLFCYTWGHGGHDRYMSRNSSHFSIKVRPIWGNPGNRQSTPLWDSAFARMTDSVHGTRVFIMQQCNGGGFMDDLCDDRTTLICAAAADHRAWSCDDHHKVRWPSPLPEHETTFVVNPPHDTVDTILWRHSEFNFHFMNALRGTAIWPYGNPQRVDTVADTSGNGAVSWYEAFRYNQKYNSQDKFPVFYDSAYRWAMMETMPLGSGVKTVSKGAALAATVPGLDDSSGTALWALKGHNTTEFWRYDVAEDTWIQKEDITWEGHKPKDGATLTSGGGGKLYATKGGSTPDFLMYDTTTGVWTRGRYVPGRKVGKGASATFAMVDSVPYIYLLKGSSTCQFYRFNIPADTWDTLAWAPAETPGRRFRQGSCIAFDGDTTVYALKGRYNGFYAYSTKSGIWTTKCGLPFVGSSGKKVKTGYGAALATCGDWVLAMKGNNSREMWAYDTRANTWLQAQDVPLEHSCRGVRYGGSLVQAGGLLWILKGNKTDDFYRFVPNRCYVEAPEQPSDPAPGGNEICLAEDGDAQDVRWSNSGEWVAYTAEVDGHRQVFKVSSDSGAPIQLTSLNGDCARPVWSPQDTSIAFEVMLDSTGYSQIAVMPGDSGAVTYLTTSSYDHWHVTWSPDGIVGYLCDDSTGYPQVYVRLTTGESPVTQQSVEHESPEFASASALTFTREGTNGYLQVYKATVGSQNETPITYASADHANPVPAGGEVFFEIDDAYGYTQVAKVPLVGGTETVLTSENYDFESPTASSDGALIFCTKSDGPGSSICQVYSSGGYAELTDDDVERVAPHARPNGGTSIAAAYVRDGDVFRLADFAGRGQQSGGLFPLALDDARPNPGRTRIVIRWQLPAEARVSLRVYNTAGQLVKVLADGRTKPGVHTSVWNGMDSKGRRLANGVYFYALDNGAKRISRKLVLTD